jgi:acyl phosphate:glycerol-3-phosphate acyltransferase
MLLAFYVLLTYLIGSIPFGVIVSTLLADTDVMGQGSHNIGATNVMRVVGPRYGAYTLVLDFLKGLVPTALAPHFFPDAWALPGVVAIAAFAGHCWSCYLEFRGGKGVATGAGGLLALDPLTFVVLAGLWGLVFAVSRKSSLAALAAVAVLPFLAIYLSPETAWVGVVLAIGITFRHRENIRRLVAGKEL